MENVTDIYTGPCSPESPYIKPFTIHYQQNGIKKSWDAVNSHDSVSVLVHNTSRNVFVFVRQFRPAVYVSQARKAERLSSDTSSYIDTSVVPPCQACTLELCAGIVDKNVTLEEIARQELLEEVGYDVPVSKLEKIVSSRSSVGVSGSRKTMFYAPVTDSMRVGQGGGNAHEGEFIEVVEMKVDECLHNILHNDTVERSIGVVFSLLWFQQFKAA